MPQRGVVADLAVGDSAADLPAEVSAAVLALGDSVAALVDSGAVSADSVEASAAALLSVQPLDSVSMIRYGGPRGPIRGRILGLTGIRICRPRRLPHIRGRRVTALQYSSIGIAAVIPRVTTPTSATATRVGNRFRRRRRTYRDLRARRLLLHGEGLRPPRTLGEDLTRSSQPGLKIYFRRRCSSSRGMISMKLHGLCR